MLKEQISSLIVCRILGRLDFGIGPTMFAAFFWAGFGVILCLPITGLAEDSAVLVGDTVLQAEVGMAQNMRKLNSNALENRQLVPGDGPGGDSFDSGSMSASYSDGLSATQSRGGWTAFREPGFMLPLLFAGLVALVFSRRRNNSR